MHLSLGTNIKVYVHNVQLNIGLLSSLLNSQFETTLKLGQSQIISVMAWYKKVCPSSIVVIQSGYRTSGSQTLIIMSFNITDFCLFVIQF